MTIIVIVIQKEVAGSASGGCTYGTATGQTFGGVRSRPTTEEEEAQARDISYPQQSVTNDQPKWIISAQGQTLTIKLMITDQHSTALTSETTQKPFGGNQ